MGFNLKQASTFVFSDADFFTKWVIGSFILVFPTLSEWFPGIKRMFTQPQNWGWLAVFIIISLIVHLSIKGYFYKAVHNNVVHDADRLPNWSEFWIYTKNGLKAYIGGSLFVAPFLLLGGGLCWLLHPNYKSLSFAVICLIAYLLLGLIYLPFSLNFATRLKIRAFFSLKRAMWLIKGKTKEFLTLYIYCITLALLSLLVSAVLSLNGLTSLLLPFFGFYIVMFYADLYAQFLNMPAEEKIKEPQNDCISV